MFFLKKNRPPKLSKHLIDIKNELKNKKPLSTGTKMLSQDDQRLIERVRKITVENNLNNVVRTKAYLDFYQKYPDIHWALLAHMVSRNGGWNMTDLTGEFFSRLLSPSPRYDFFSFIERGNWLIFQDAYPQLLLYEESMKKGKSYFYLLPFFNISTFMETIWNHYLINKNTYILTMALVVNEQNYIENRVVQNPKYKVNVLDTLEFKLQDILSFNHILFPYSQNGLTLLKGQTLHLFDSLHERILLGKRLYSLLFHSQEFLNKVTQWAVSHPHTASRKDYWPNIFNHVHESLPWLPLQIRLKNCQLRPGVSKIYSPKLTDVWKNVTHEEAENGDWYEDWRVIDYLIEDPNKLEGEIMVEYCETLEMLELAALAKKVIFN